MKIELWLTRKEAEVVASTLEDAAQKRGLEERTQALESEGFITTEAPILQACAATIRKQHAAD